MSVRTKMLGFVDVILRVPPIFIIDEILRVSMGLPFSTHTDSTITSVTLDSNHSSLIIGDDNATNSSQYNQQQILNGSTIDLFGSASVRDDAEFYKILSLTSLKFFSCLLGECHHIRYLPPCPPARFTCSNF